MSGTRLRMGLGIKLWWGFRVDVGGFFTDNGLSLCILSCAALNKLWKGKGMRNLRTALLALFIASPLFGQAKPTALVYEHKDQWTQSLGALELLEQGGFGVSDLSLGKSPLECEADMIFLGSFTSESEAYKQYMKSFAAELRSYVEKGHLLVQMVQADQTEETPPFLPSSLGAMRADQDFSKAHIVSASSHLLQGLPEISCISFHPRATVWESFVDQKGFEVTLAGDKHAQFPALLEGALGKGRIILSSLALDKQSFGSFGEPNEAIDKVREVFFQNLARHAMAIRNQTAEPLNVTPSPIKAADFVEGSWTLVLLPDIQNYSQYYPGLLLAQTAWIVQNQSKHNIKFVLQLGDITNHNAVEEWENARMALSLMNGRAPYAFCPGNHDYGPGGNASTRETHLNEYLPLKDYALTPTFGGAMVPGKMDNTFHLFEAGGRKWIVLALEWAPRDVTVAWANKVMNEHPGRKGILITHAYMNNNDLRYDHTDTENPQTYNPHLYSTPGSKNDGRQLWEKLVSKHDFVFAFNGHVLGDGTGYLAEKNKKGKVVHQMLANYQMRQLGGEGYMRLLEFLPDGKTVQVKTFSPLYGKYLLEPDQQFCIKLDF